MGFAKGEIGCNLNYSRVVARGPVERVASLKRQKEVRGGSGSNIWGWQKQAK